MYFLYNKERNQENLIFINILKINLELVINIGLFYILLDYNKIDK